MKFIEISNGFLQPISNEESMLFEMVKNYKTPFPKSNMNEREKEVARNLVSRGILTRIVSENKLYFIVNDLTDIWER